MERLTYFRQCFKLAEKKGLIKFTVKGDWFDVDTKETLTAQGDTSKWRFLCAQSLRDYTHEEKDREGNNIAVIDELALVNRVTLMLCEQLRSTRQDVNIYRDEYDMTKKPFCFCVSGGEGGHYKNVNCN